MIHVFNNQKKIFKEAFITMLQDVRTNTPFKTNEKIRNSQQKKKGINRSSGNFTTEKYSNRKLTWNIYQERPNPAPKTLLNKFKRTAVIQSILSVCKGIKLEIITRNIVEKNLKYLEIKITQSMFTDNNEIKKSVTKYLENQVFGSNNTV